MMNGNQRQGSSLNYHDLIELKSTSCLMKPIRLLCIITSPHLCRVAPVNVVLYVK